MASSNDQATFSLNLEGNADQGAARVGSSLEALRAQVAGSRSSIADMSASLKSLRGDSELVKNVKSELVAKIAAEKDALSAATLAITAQGTSFGALADKARKAAREQEELKKTLAAKDLEKSSERVKGFGAAVQTAGGPVAELRSKLENLRSIAGGAGAGFNVAALAVAGLVAVAAALVVKLGEATIGLVRFVLAGGDASKSMRLFLEGSTQGATNAGHLANQILELADKVPISTAELSKLGAELARLRIPGGAVVDIMNLAAQATAGAGASVGNALKDIATRGQLVGRFFLNPRELLGTNVKFDAVAAELGKGMGLSIDKAKQALLTGKVTLADGAKALRGAVEKQFGGINADKMVTFENIVETLKKKFVELTKDVDLSPIYDGLKQIVHLFDKGSVTGALLKSQFELIGKVVGMLFASALPEGISFFDGLLIGALKFEIAVLKLAVSFRESFRSIKTFLDEHEAALTAGKIAVLGIAGAFGLLGVAIAAGFAPALAMAGLLGAAIFGIQKAVSWLLDVKWSELGTAIVDGIVNGLKAGVSFLKDAVSGLASSIKSTFKSILDIHSPSRVFAGYGMNTTEGYAQGIEKGSPRVEDAVSEMAPSAPAGSTAASGGASRGSSGPVTINLTINAGEGTTPSDVTDSRFLSQLTIAIERALLGDGKPVSA